jgi:signal transduction histidine kinase
LEAAESADAYAALLTQAVAWLLQAEYCLLLTTPAPDGELAIGAGYDTTLRKPVIAMPLDSLQVPVLVQAMTLGRSVHLPGGTHSPDARSVLRSLGLAGKSPALLVPLLADGRTVAGLLLLSPRAQRVWDDATRLALEQVAPRMGERLQHWIEHSTLREASEASLDIEQARRRIAELESRLERAIAQPTELIGVDELRNELDDARLAIDMLEAEVERLRSAASTLAAPTASVGGSTPRQDSERLQAELTLALQALAEARASTTPAAAAPGVSPEARGALPASIHGARQPLTTISGYTELLLGESIGLLGSTQRRFLERIRAAVRRIDEELNSLAESLPGYEAAPTQAAHDLGALIEQALEVIQVDLRAKGLSVRLDLPPTPVRVPGDATSIRTIVSRLLANAADVTPAGREILLSVLPGAGDGVVLLTVSDLGRGVAPTDLGRVFSGDIWTDPVPGLGRDSAGLAMVKTLSESLGGRVWVESRPGGTTFSVLLPSASGTPA